MATSACLSPGEEQDPLAWESIAQDKSADGARLAMLGHLDDYEHADLTEASFWAELQTLAGGQATVDMAGLPSEVLVWRRGTPTDNDTSCAGTIDRIPLEEYVTRVVAREMYPSWPIETLKAGAVAARTFVVYHILNGKKYACADVDDTVRSQALGATSVLTEAAYANVRLAVAATAGQVLVTDRTKVLLTEYAKEHGPALASGAEDPVCAGQAIAGHGRGMCQQGASRWAALGYDYADILAHYYLRPGYALSLYGGDIAIPATDPMAHQATSPPTTPPPPPPATPPAIDCTEASAAGVTPAFIEVVGGNETGKISLTFTNTSACSWPYQSAALVWHDGSRYVLVAYPNQHKTIDPGQTAVFDIKLTTTASAGVETIAVPFRLQVGDSLSNAQATVFGRKLPRQ